ncbi:hypothetical protein [Streptomyces sp. NPDC048650]|uniref:hypothetical protein n=1 Tax=Streptomyces sp. NPDC048650 TaxID=3365583 RepID=UPI0037160F5D
MAFEVDQEQERVRLTSDLQEKALSLPESPEFSRPSSTEHLAHFPQLRALAAAETREVPLPAWSVLCTALGLQRAPADLHRTVNALPQMLSMRTDSAGAEYVRFRVEGVRHLLRAQLPLSLQEHSNITHALLAESLHLGTTGPWRTQGPAAEYAFHALPIHSAAADMLIALSQNPRFLANVDRHALVTGLKLSHPHGIPTGNPASDVHYLEAAGVEPATHEEWICWLHWASMNRGATDFAEELARSAGELPWLTRWSRWRPYGIFGPRLARNRSRERGRCRRQCAGNRRQRDGRRCGPRVQLVCPGKSVAPR